MDQEEQILREIYKEGKEDYGLQGKAMQVMITQELMPRLHRHAVEGVDFRNHRSKNKSN
jgi:hypothetical protein